MTIAEVKKQLQRNDMTLRKTEANEFRVAFREDGNNSEAAAYYASDLEDALLTGLHMRLMRNVHRQP